MWCHKLAQAFVPVLQDVCVNKFTINDSFLFAQEVQRIQLDNCVLASLDIESFFPNTSVTEAIKVITDKLVPSRRKFNRFNHGLKGLTKQNLIDLLTAASNSSFFTFNDTLYQQLEGVSMGSPLGPSLANGFSPFMNNNG